MKKIILSFIISIFFISNIFSNMNIDKIGVINYEEVIMTVFSGKSQIIKEVKQEKEELNNYLKDKKTEIMDYENKKSKEKDSSKKLAYQKKIDELKKEYADYYKIKSYQIKKRMNNIGPLINEIKSAVQVVAEREGYSIILDINSDDIFYYSLDIEVTQKVIDFLNEKFDDE